MRVFPLCTWLMAAGALSAQHEVTPAQIEEGGRLYRTNCVLCHGSDGDLMPGVHLGMGIFRGTRSDQDLVKIIRTGTGGGMPAIGVAEAQAGAIVSYLRSLEAAATSSLPKGGDAARGKAVFEGQGACLTCHRIRGNGSRLGPELTDVGSLRRPAELERAILDPGAAVLPQHRFARVVTKAGATVTGRLLEQNSFTVSLMDSQERLRLFSRGDLREYTILKDSQMPSYRGRLSAEEVADVITYLFSLKGAGQP